MHHRSLLGGVGCFSPQSDLGLAKEYVRSVLTDVVVFVHLELHPPKKKKKEDEVMSVGMTRGDANSVTVIN